MIRFSLILAIVLPALLWAQIGGDPGAVYEMATENNIYVGVRAAGMGGAQIAAGEDGSALWYNPALLTRVRRIELSGALTHQRFFNETKYGTVNSKQAQMNKTRLSSFWAVLPVPVEQGGLSLALSVNRVKSFDRILRLEDKAGWFETPVGDGYGYGEDDIGGLWAYSIGGAIEISRHTSVGASIDFFDGKDTFSRLIDEVDGSYYYFRSNLEDSYSGYSGKVGIAYSTGPNVHLGAVIRFPTPIAVSQMYDDYQYDDGDISITYPTEAEYEYTLPFSFGAGAAFVVRDLLIAGDIVYTDYTQIEYKSGFSSLAEANIAVKRNYRDVLAWSLGAEYFFPEWGLSLRGGINKDPIPFEYYSIDEDLMVFTAGFSYLLDRTLKMDFAVNFLNWTRYDYDPDFDRLAKEKFDTQRFFIGFTYRI